MKLVKKIATIILVLAMISIPVLSFASDAANSSFWEGLFGSGGSDAEQKVLNVGGSVLSIIRTIGFIVALGMLIWIGIKWITSTAQERADLKGKAVNYVIGAVFVFGASFILPIIVKFIQDTLK